MRVCYAVEIITPKKYFLRGLWFGSKTPKRTVVWVHGLGSSMFSKLSTVEKLIDKETAVLMFNNRGHDKISRLARTNERKISKTHLAGAAHEIFTDCVDDIQGAVNFARRQGMKNVFLAGHSTGCQKSIYWASRTKGGRGVKGIILLGPTSDWAGETMLQGRQKIRTVTAVARSLVRRGKKHELLPPGLWHEVLDAQRFLSLYTPNSVEEIFSYAQPTKNPRTLESVRIPILVLWAEKDEFSDQPPQEVAEWFGTHTQKGKIIVLPRTGHLFRGAEVRVARTIRQWMKQR